MITPVPNFRRLKRTLIYLLIAVSFSACRGHDKEPTLSNEDSISFATVFSDTIEPKCVSCHNSTNAKGGYNLENYRALMAGGSVVPKNPEASLFHRTISHARMPPGQPLFGLEVRKIESWIRNGAKEFAPPTISEISPRSGLAAIEVEVRVIGFGFTKNSRVVFGGKFFAKEVQFVSSNELSATTPSLPSGTYDVSVINPDGAKDSKYRAYHSGYGNSNGLEITSVFPNKGSNGTYIQVRGSGFETTSTVTVNDLPCINVTVQVPDSISCQVPLAIRSNVADVIVKNGDYEYRFSPGFTYNLSASYTTIKNDILLPKCGTCHGTGNPNLIVSGSYATFMSKGKIVPFAPENSPLYLSLFPNYPTPMPKNAPALSEAEIGLIYDFIFNGAPDDSPPIITSLTVVKGTTLGGTSIKLIGTGFLPGLTVYLGGAACVPATVNLPGTEISCVTGAQAAGLVRATVINPAVAGSTQQPGIRGNAYTYALDPTITSISPSSVVSSNTAEVEFTGTNFIAGNNNMRFRFGENLFVDGTATSCNVSNVCTKVRVVPPALPVGTYTVRVTDQSSSQFSDYQSFNYIAGGLPPTVDSVSVGALTFPIVYTGTTPTVTIRGTGFFAAPKVVIGGEDAVVLTVNSTTITARPDADVLEGSQPVTVTNTNTLSGSLANAFDYRTTPDITSLGSTSLPVSGGGLRLVGLNGVGFVAGSTITVDGTSCTPVDVLSSTQAACSAPSFPVAKNNVTVRLTLPADPNGIVKEDTISNLNLRLVIDTLVPAVGPLAGNTPITIPGDGFLASTVSIGGVACTISGVTQTSISCTTGANTAGAKSVVVTNGNGATRTITGGFTYQ